MIGVVLEAGLLAVPPIAASEAEVEAIIDRLTAWSRAVVGSDVIKILQMSDTTDVLGLCNAWPSGDNVEALLDLYGLREVYTPKEVSRLINTIIERSQIVEDVAGIEVTDCLAIDEPKIAYQHQLLKEAGRRVFATLCSGLAKEPIFLAPAATLAGSNASWRGQVLGVSMAKVAQMQVAVPFSVFGSLKLAQGPNCVATAISAIDVWNAAQDATGLHFAILLKMREIVASGGKNVTLDTLPRFDIGSDFYASLSHTQSDAYGKFAAVVLETCARVALGNPKYTIDPFTKGPRSKNQEQWERPSDGALGYRTHVTKGAEGLRLFIWRSKLGPWELAKIALHNDQSVCHGSIGHCVRKSW